MANGKWSDVVDFDEGQFRARVVYSYTNSSITWHLEIDVIKEFKSKHTYVVKWINPEGNWKQADTNSKYAGDYKGNNINTARPDLTVIAQVGRDSEKHKAVKLEKITNSANAETPTKIKVKKINDARYEITVKGRGYVTKPTTKLTIERATDTKTSWSVIKTYTMNTDEKYERTYEDPTTETGHRYWYRAKATSAGGDSGYIVSDAEFTSPDTDVSITIEQGDGKNIVRWSIDSVELIDRNILKGWIVSRSVNDGAYEDYGKVPAKVTQYDYLFEDYDVSFGNTYKYAVRSYGKGGESHETQEAGTELETIPSKPVSVKAYLNASDYCVLNIVDNISNTATEVLIERSIDGGEWTQIASETFPIDTYVDESAVGSESLKYRIRNKNSVGYSAYTESNEVQLRSKPNPPSLLQPYNNTIQDVSSQPIRLVWMHNATDGSPQREAEIKVTIDGVAQTYTATTQSYVEIAGFDINDSVEWTVRTKGSHADFSNWSAPYSFRVLKKPELMILSPQNDETITTLPITLEWLYNDLSGELKELTITLIKGNKEVATYTADPSTSEYSLAGFLFENHSIYGIRIDALSTTGLRASQLISIVIEYEEVSLEGGLLPTVVTDDDGFAYITIGRDITAEEGEEPPEPIEIIEAYLYRLHDKQRTLIGDVNEGTQLIDKYAPLNVDYEYELLQLTIDGRVSLVSVTVSLPSVYSFIYYEDEIFKGKWNPKIGSSYDRPERALKQYSGRKYPLAYDSKAMTETNSYSCVLVDRSDLVQLKEMMRSGHGRGVWKSVDGDSFDAVFKLEVDTDKYYKTQTWNVTLDVTRIEKNE